MKRTFFAVVLVFIMGVASTSQASLPMSIELTCPVDGTQFKVSEIGSMTTMGQNADLSRNGAIGSLYEGHVHSCPQCHFSGTQQDFKQTLSEPLKQQVLTHFASYLPGQRLSDLSEVDLTLQMYRWQQRSPLDFIELALNGSYLAKPPHEDGERLHEYYFGDHRIKQTKAPARINPKRQYYQALTAEYIELAWKQNLLKDTEKSLYAYLAGEMLRRCSQFKQAESWYQQALSTQPPQQTPAFIDLIHRQLKLAQERDNNDSL